MSRSRCWGSQHADVNVFYGLGAALNFRPLRKTFAPRLPGSGEPQELMRHQDANLTAQPHTDASLLPTFDAVASLKWEGDKPAPYTHIDTQTIRPGGSKLATRWHGKASDGSEGKP